MSFEWYSQYPQVISFQSLFSVRTSHHVHVYSSLAFHAPPPWSGEWKLLSNEMHWVKTSLLSFASSRSFIHAILSESVLIWCIGKGMQTTSFKLAELLFDDFNSIIHIFLWVDGGCAIVNCDWGCIGSAEATWQQQHHTENGSDQFFSSCISCCKLITT